MALAPIRIQHNFTGTSFVDKVVTEAISASYNLSWNGGYDQGQMVRSQLNRSSAAPPSVLAEPAFRCLLEGIGRVVEQMLINQELVLDENTDLTKCDYEMLERIYTAAGAEMDRRRNVVPVPLIVFGDGQGNILTNREPRDE